MDTIIEWSFDDLRHTEERVAKLEWGAARTLSPEAKACDLLVPFAWIFEKLSTAQPEAARSAARAARAPRAAAAPRPAPPSRWRFVRILETFARAGPGRGAGDRFQLLSLFARLAIDMELEVDPTSPFWCVRGEPPRAATVPPSRRPFLSFVEVAEVELALDTTRPPPRARFALAAGSSAAVHANFERGARHALNADVLFTSGWCKIRPRPDELFGHFLKNLLIRRRSRRSSRPSRAGRARRRRRAPRRRARASATARPRPRRPPPSSSCASRTGSGRPRRPGSAT